MYTVEQIKQFARTSTLYDEQHPQGQLGFMLILDGQTLECGYSEASGSCAWYVQGERVRESAVQSLLTQHRQ